jgi:hypothetical protein
MPKSLAALGKVVLLFASLFIPLSFAWAEGNVAVADDGPDQQLKEFRLGDLEATLATMQPGAERDYFAGVLANRAGRIPESIRLLNSVLPSLRTARPDRAAVALQALADDYTKSFQYGDAAQADDDLLTHFSSQLEPPVVLSGNARNPMENLAQETAFGADIDYAMLQKIYGAPPIAEMRRYSPAKCIGSDMKVVSGDPDPKHVSTSYVERHNLTMRMGMRRFTRLTNGFSNKFENHAAMVAIHAVYYNFARIHKTLRVTPALAAGLSDHVWSLEEIVTMADNYMPKPAKRGPYKKSA